MTKIQSDYAIKLQIYPNKHQQFILDKTFDNCRFVYNQMLAMLNERYKNNKKLKFPNKYSLSRLLSPLKKEYRFLKESDSTAYEYETFFLYQGFVNMFKHLAKHPRFHSRFKDNKTFTSSSSTVAFIDDRHVRLPKVGIVRSNKVANVPDNRPYRATISSDATGRYYVSFHLHGEFKSLDPTGKMIGIDRGISKFLATSDNQTFDYDKEDFKNLEMRLKVEQRKLSRRYQQAKINIERDKAEHPDNVRTLEDFSNYQKQKCIVAKIHKHIANKRLDYIQKITTELVKKYDLIALEDLKVNNMLKNHHLAHAISDVAWTTFKSVLAYKCLWYGKQFLSKVLSI